MKNQNPNSKNIFRSPRNFTSPVKSQKCNRIQTEILIQTNTIKISTFKLEKQLKIYQWRSTTEFPIIKILGFKIKQNRSQSSIVQVRLNTCFLRLSQIKNIPLFKVIYLLKQSLIGYQRLVNRFGPFKIRSSMIAIDHYYHCRVWLNQHFQSNFYQPSLLSEQQFLDDLITIFQQCSNKIKKTLIFFNYLRKFKTFYQMLSFIDEYCKQNKLSVPSFCKFNQNQIIKNNRQQIIGSSLNYQKLISTQKKIKNHDFRYSLNNNTKMNFFDSFKQSTKFKTQKQLQSLNIKSINSPTNKLEWSKQFYDFTTDYNFSNGMKSRNKIISESIFADKIQQNIIIKSQLPVKINNQTMLNHRKFKSYGEDITNNKKQINCPENSPLFKKSKSQEQKQEQQIQHKINNMFLQNNWQKIINSKLLYQNTQLKNSIYQEKDKTKHNDRQRKLKYLIQYGRDVQESIIAFPKNI